MTTDTANYYISGATELVEAICETVDDLTQEDRCMILFLVNRARRGPLSERCWNIFAAQTKDIRDRVRRNVTVRRIP